LAQKRKFADGSPKNGSWTGMEVWWACELCTNQQKDGIKATGASVHAGTCGYADGWNGSIRQTEYGCGMDAEVGVGSDEECSLMDSPGVVCSGPERWVCVSV
jgi:hypothetical protein